MMTSTTQSETGAHGFCRNAISSVHGLMNSDLVDQLRRIERIAAVLPNLDPKVLNPAQREEIRQSQGFECYYCDARIYDRPNVPHENKMHVDHNKVPICRGGSNCRWNLAALCAPCNLRKATKTDREYRKLYADFITKPKRPSWDDIVNELLAGDMDSSPGVAFALLRTVKSILRWAMMLVRRHPVVAIVVVAVIVVMVVGYMLYRRARNRGRDVVRSAARRSGAIAGRVRELPGGVVSFAGRTHGTLAESAGRLAGSSRSTIADRRRRFHGALRSKVATLPEVAWHRDRGAGSADAGHGTPRPAVA